MGPGTFTDKQCPTLIITALPEQSTQRLWPSVLEDLFSRQNAEQLEKGLSLNRLMLEEMKKLRAYLRLKKFAIEKLQAEGSTLPISEQIRTELETALTTVTLAEKFKRYITGYFELNQAVLHAYKDGKLDPVQAYANWQHIDLHATSARFHAFGSELGGLQTLCDKLQSIETEPDERAVASTQLWDEWEIIECSRNCVEDECQDEA